MKRLRVLGGLTPPALYEPETQRAHVATDDRWDDEDDRRPQRRPLTREEAREKVRPPAIALIVVGVISLLMLPLSIVQYATLPAQFEEQSKQFDANPNMPPEQKQQAKDILQTYQQIVTTALPVSWGLVAISSLLIIVGAVKMMSLSSRGWGMTASILAMLPCVSGCCLLGVPFGIWAIVVLNNKEVAAAFAANRNRPDAEPVDDFDDRRNLDV
jgi:hypothetical protein